MLMQMLAAHQHVICSDEKPMAITITSKPKPVVTVPPICHDFETGVITNSHIISNYSAPQVFI